jgi:hypothetical protein
MYLVCFCGDVDLLRVSSSPVNLYAVLSSQLKCAHLVPAKAPLPEEAIFNRNKTATERRCIARKAQHKECQIAKRDRNDNRIKRRKAGERGVSSDEDPLPEPLWSGDVASTPVDWSDMSRSSSSSPPCGAEVSPSRRPQAATRDKNVGSSSRQAAHPAREDQRKVRVCAEPSRTGVTGSQSAAPCQAYPPRRSEERPTLACQLYDGSDHPDSDSLQRRRSRGKSADSVSAPSAPQVMESGATPWCLQPLLIQGGGAPDVHVSLVVGGDQGPTLAVVEAGGSAPEQSVERVAAVEAAVWSGAAPKSVGSKRAAPEQGSKHAAPKQGSSGRPAKKPWVRSKM